MTAIAQTVLNTNSTSLIAQERLRMNQRRWDRAADMLASGKRVNSPKDDAAAYGLGKILSQGIQAGQMALQNVQNGVSMLQVAEGGLSQITENLQRIRELVVGMASDTSVVEGPAQEIRSLMEDINRVSQAASFNDVKLLDGTTTTARIQTGVGSNAALNTLELAPAFANADSTSIGLINGTASGGFITTLDDVFNGTTTAIANNQRALLFLSDVDEALAQINQQRATLGAFENQLSRKMEFIQLSVDNDQLSRSRLEDANFAEVTAEYTQAQVLQQAAVSVLAQSNSSNESLLTLLQR